MSVALPSLNIIVAISVILGSHKLYGPRSSTPCVRAKLGLPIIVNAFSGLPRSREVEAVNKKSLAEPLYGSRETSFEKKNILPHSCAGSGTAIYAHTAAGTHARALASTRAQALL